MLGGWIFCLPPFPLLHTLKSPCQLEPWWNEEVFATCLPCSGASASPTVVPINTTPFLKLWCHTLTKQVGPSQWCLPKIPAFRKLRQENSCEIEGQPGLWCISPLQTNNPQIKKKNITPVMRDRAWLSAAAQTRAHCPHFFSCPCSDTIYMVSVCALGTPCVSFCDLVSLE